MKVRSIPAQITTVEDKIAGNLSLTQIFLLMIPVFWLMLVYTVLPPYMHFSLYKLPIVLFIGIISLTLALRIKDKIALNWLVILLRYNTRPKYYLFNKNDAYMRTMDIISVEKNKRKVKAKAQVKEKENDVPVSLGDLTRLEGLLVDPSYSFSIKSQKKGALYVAIEQNKK
jgi:CBS domain containing-hemolysin-like protein